jgi:dUTPase
MCVTTVYIKDSSDNNRLQELNYIETKANALYLKTLNHIVLKPGDIQAITTDIAVKIPQHVLGIISSPFPQAFTINKFFLQTATIDSTYTAPIEVLITNCSKENVILNSGFTIAKLTFIRCKSFTFELVKNLDVIQEQFNQNF